MEVVCPRRLLHKPTERAFVETHGKQNGLRTSSCFHIYGTGRSMGSDGKRTHELFGVPAESLRSRQIFKQAELPLVIDLYVCPPTID